MVLFNGVVGFLGLLLPWHVNISHIGCDTVPGFVQTSAGTREYANRD